MERNVNLIECGNEIAFPGTEKVSLRDVQKFVEFLSSQQVDYQMQISQDFMNTLSFITHSIYLFFSIILYVTVWGVFG